MPTTSVRSVSTNLLRVLPDAGLQLGAEVTDQTLDGPGKGLTQSADGVTLDLLGQLLEHVDLTLAGLTLLHTLHHLHGPLAALTAGSALTARLVLVEGGQTRDGANNVGRLVHDDNGSGTETTLRVLQGVEVHELVVTNGLGKDGSRGSTGNDSEEVVPAATDTSTVAVDQLAQGDRHLLLDSAGVVDVSGDTEKLGTSVALTAERREPAGATTHDGGGDGDSLDVGDGTGAAEETDSSGERGLKTGLAGLTLDGLDEGGLLTTDVGAHTTVDVDVEVVAGTAGVLADQASLVGLVDSPLENGSFLVKFTTDVDVSGVGVHGTADDEATFDELLGVFAHDFTILAGSGLTLIGIDDEVTGSGVLVPVLEVHEGLYHID